MHVQTAGSQRWSSMWITSYYCTSTWQFDSPQFWSIMGSLLPAAGIQLWMVNNVKFTWGLSYLHDVHNTHSNLGSQDFIPTRLWHHFLSLFLSPVYTKFKPVKGLDTFIVKRLQILMVSSVLSAPQNKSYFLSGSSFLLDIGYSWALENWLDYSSFFFPFLHQDLCYRVWQQKQHPNHESLKVGQYIGDFWGYTLPVMCWRIGLVD